MDSKQIMLVVGAGALGVVLGFGIAKVSRHREERRGAAVASDWGKFCYQYPMNPVCKAI
jgi:hypothetical protein